MKKRVVSAILMVLLFVPFLLLGGIPFAIFIGVLGILGLKEMLDLEKDIPKVIKFISLFLGLFLILYNYKDINFTQIVDYKILGLLFFFSTVSLVIKGDLKKYNYKDALLLTIIVFLIGMLFNNLIHLRNIGIPMVIYIFLIATMTDTFALFCGKYFGKHKLSPNISPNKTIEGSLGGSIFGTIISVIFYLFFIEKGVNILMLVSVTFILTIIGQIGDLFFSSIKRHYKVKDFSNLIPGHGGILDRLDSIIFVMMAYILISNLF